MTFTLLVGISAALFATGLAVAYQRAPTRARCPECGGATRTVVPPFWLRATAPRLMVRWCPRCSWQGLGRAGPERIEGQKIAHDSGFHWGAERLPEDFGFVWRTPSDITASSGPPDHPSGFRFAPTPGDPTAPRPPGAAHRSGFLWSTPAKAAEGARAGARKAGTPFEWGGGKRQPPHAL